MQQKKGPFSLCIDGSPGHEVLLVGYDQLTSNNSFGLDEDDPRLVRTYLIVKNSWGQTWGETGFANVLFNNPTYLTDCCSMSVPIIRRNHLSSSGIGGTVKIINGGKIQRHKSPQFILPDGISLEMDEGSIFE